MRESVKVNDFILVNEPEDRWVYGHGFWSNSRGVMWPDLPRDAFTAAGAGGHYVSVFPSQQARGGAEPRPLRQPPQGREAGEW